MKRICSLVQEYYPRDFRVRRVAESLTDRGYSVDVIALRNVGERAFENVNGVNVYRVNLRKKRGRTIEYIFYYAAFTLLASFKCSLLFMKRRYDVIVVNNPPDFLVFAAVVPKVFGARIVVDLHEIVYEDFKTRFNAFGKRLILLIIKVVTGLALKFVDDYITVNDILAQKYYSRYRLKRMPTVVMNAVDASKVMKRGARNYVEGGDFVIVYHGTLSKHYGVHVAIEALKILVLKRGFVNLRFDIVGEGKETEHLKSLVERHRLERNVRFHGYVSWDRLQEYLNDAHVAVIPTVKSAYTDLSLSNKLMESIFFEIPVIASNIETYLWYFPEDSVTYFRSGDALDLANKIEFAMRNYRSMLEKAKKAFDIYNEKYRWEMMVDRYVNVVDCVRR